MIAIWPISLPLSTLTSTEKVSPGATAVSAAGLTMDMPLEEKLRGEGRPVAPAPAVAATSFECPRASLVQTRFAF